MLINKTLLEISIVICPYVIPNRMSFNNYLETIRSIFTYRDMYKKHNIKIYRYIIYHSRTEPFKYHRVIATEEWLYSEGEIETEANNMIVL